MDLLGAHLFAQRFLAEATDGHLSEAECVHLHGSALQYMDDLGGDAEAVGRAFAKVEATFDGLLDGGGPVAVVKHFRRCVAALGDGLQDDPEALAGVLREMQAVADADGVLHPMEEHFLQEMARTWLVRRAVQGIAAGSDGLRPFVLAQLYLGQTGGAIQADELATMQESWDLLASARSIDRMVMQDAVRAAADDYAAAAQAGEEELHHAFLAALAEVRSHWADAPDVLASMADAMLRLAASDGIIDDLEGRLLQDIAAAWQRTGTDPV